MMNYYGHLDGPTKEDAKKQIEDAGGKVLFGTGSAGVANNINKDGTQGGQVGYNNGNCYQIRINNDNMGNDENEPPFTDVIMQSINTGLPNAFDIQMPAGGAGAFPDEGIVSNLFNSISKSLLFG